MAWWFYLVLSLAGIVWIGLRDGTVSLRLFFAPGGFLAPQGWWFDLFLGLACGASLLAAWAAASRWLPLARRLEGQMGTLLGRLEPAEVVGLAVVSSLGEELFFRGALQGSIGWLWATVLFALIHHGPGPAFRLWTLFAAIAGGLFGGLFLWRGNLLAPVVAHFLVNAVNLHRIARRGPSTRGAGEAP